MRLFAVAVVSGIRTGGIKYNTTAVIASSVHEAVGMGIEMCRQTYPHNVNHNAVAVEVEFNMIASTVYHMSEDERTRLMELVAAYDDARGPNEELANNRPSGQIRGSARTGHLYHSRQSAI